MGFWSSLAGIATSFIPGVGPLLAPLVSGGISALTGGNAAGGGQTATAGQVNPALQSTLDQIKSQGATGAADTASGMKQLDTASSTADQAGSLYRAGAGGSMETLQQMLGPEISTVMSQFDNAAKTAAEFGPRGGGRTGVMAELPFKKAAAAGNLIGQARQGAVAGLADTAKTQASVGQAKTAAGTAQTGQALGTTAALLAPKTQSENLANQNQLTMGKGIGTILGNIFSGKIGTGGGGGGSSSSSGGYGAGGSYGGVGSGADGY
jgi:hypothetical protein